MMLHPMDNSYLDTTSNTRFYVKAPPSVTIGGVYVRTGLGEFLLQNGFLNAADAQAALDEFIVSTGQPVMVVPLPPVQE